MSNDPWIGDENTTLPPGRCCYSEKPGASHCDQPATVHIMSESAISGLVGLVACDRHALVARAAGPCRGEHAFGLGCSRVPALWQDLACQTHQEAAR